MEDKELVRYWDSWMMDYKKWERQRDIKKLKGAMLYFSDERDENGNLKYLDWYPLELK
jgi:hypothetical protein